MKSGPLHFVSSLAVQLVFFFLIMFVSEYMTFRYKGSHSLEYITQLSLLINLIHIIYIFSDIICDCFSTSVHQIFSLQKIFWKIQDNRLLIWQNRAIGNKSHITNLRLYQILHRVRLNYKVNLQLYCNFTFFFKTTKTLKISHNAKYVPQIKEWFRGSGPHKWLMSFEMRKVEKNHRPTHD